MTNMNVTGTAEVSRSSSSPWKNPWVLLALGIVVVTVIVNSFYISLAYANRPALVNAEYYERGRDLERTLMTRQREWQELGWQIELHEPEQIVLDQPGLYRFLALTRDGEPLRQAEGWLRLQRSADINADFRVALVERRPGEYVANVSFPLKGVWDVVVDFDHSDGSISKKRRLSVAEAPVAVN